MLLLSMVNGGERKEGQKAKIQLTSCVDLVIFSFIVVAYLSGYITMREFIVHVARWAGLYLFYLPDIIGL